MSHTLLHVHVSVIPEPVPTPSPALTTKTLILMVPPPPPIVSAISSTQKQTTPIPTPPITTIAPSVTTIVPDPLLTIIQRVSSLEKDVKELKQVDHSTTILASVRSQVPSVDPLTFDELMATPIGFSKFAMNFLKIDKLTKAHLVGPIYYLLKGTGQSSIELDYNMEECYKALSDQLDWNNPEGDYCPLDLSKPLPLKGRLGYLTVASEYFFNNDLEYLKSSDPETKYTTSITKTKAARYELVGIEDMISNLSSVTKIGYDKDAKRGIKLGGPKRQQFYRAQLNKLSKHDVCAPLNILSVVSLRVDKLHGYGYLEEILDMLLLVIQHKLFNLVGEVIIDLAVALCMFSRSLVIKRRVEDV
nr:hypothetical protein [Tanacetum cinerariifolium]